MKHFVGSIVLMFEKEVNMIEELYNLYKKDVYFYIYSLCKNDSLSEDLTSETFIQVILSLPSFKEKSDIKTWIFAIARHVTYKELKKRKKEVSVDFPLEFPIFDEYSYTKEEIMQLIETKPITHKLIFKLRVEGYSYDEIASKVNLSSSSTRVIFFRMKNELKQKLERGENSE